MSGSLASTVQNTQYSHSGHLRRLVDMDRWEQSQRQPFYQLTHLIFLKKFSDIIIAKL